MIVNLRLQISTKDTFLVLSRNFYIVAALLIASQTPAFISPVEADRFSGLCPSGYPRQVTLNGTGKCYPVGSPGPCPPMMNVASSPYNPNFGYCRCKSLGNTCFGRPLLEWDDRCYFEFSQGPCRKGHWLVRDRYGYGECQKSPCPLIENQKDLLRAAVPRNDYYFTLDNSFECYQTGTQAFCNEGYKVYFLGTQRFPRCLNYEPIDCEHYSSSTLKQNLALRLGQGNPPLRPSPGFGIPYDGI